MRSVLLSLGAALAVATPAFADEARVEVHTGTAWNDGQTANGTVGGAIGYDFDLGGKTFVGVEESVDKQFKGDTYARFGSTVRIGTKLTPATKLYALTGYSYGVGPNATHVGGGIEQAFGKKMYMNLEYRHYFDEDNARDQNAVQVGVGTHF